MNRTIVFKSAEGREKIRSYYNNDLSFFPFTKRYVETSFGKTFVLEAGTKEHPPMILLHGSCSNSASWLGDIAKLAVSWHVYALDIPGEPGNSDDNRLDIESAEYVDWLMEALDVLQVGNPAIIGNSLGGWLALHFAAKFPQRTKALVLAAPSGIIHPKEDFLRQLENLDSNDISVKNINDMILGDVELPKEVVKFMTLIAQNFNPITKALPILTEVQLSMLRMPLLYLAGKDDATMDVEKASQKLLEFVPHAVVSISSGSHVITTLADIALDFLSSESPCRHG